MITNTSCTIYNQLEDGTYKRTYLPAAFWRSVKGYETKKYGAENASTISVTVFADQLHDYISPAEFSGEGWTVDPNGQRTVIVKGECVLEDISEILEQPEAYTVNDAVEGLFGSPELWNIKIGAV